MDVKPDADNAATPTVQAHTEFPTAGLYKLWAQFQRGGMNPEDALSHMALRG